MTVSCYWLIHDATQPVKKGWKRPTVGYWRGRMFKTEGIVHVNGQPMQMVTIFDHSTTPPTLIRSDYALMDLETFGAKLPPAYIDYCGDITRTKDRQTLLLGDTRPYFDSLFDKRP